MFLFKTDAPSKLLPNRTLCLSLLTATALIAPQAAHAQAVPGTADAGRVEERIREQTPRIEPGADIEVKAANIAQAPAGAEKVKLTLKSLSLEGESAYTEEYLTQIYQDKIGKDITLADIYEIAGDITKHYRENGYVLTQVVVPPQSLDKQADAKLQIVEGYIDRVIVEGVDDSEEFGTQLQDIRAYTSRLNENAGAVNISMLERTLLLINDLPGVSARSILAPSTTTTGAADLRVIVSRKKVDGYIAYDTFGSRYLGPHQFIGASTFNSWLGLNERVTLQGVYAPDSDFDPELAYGSFYYEMPVNRYGTWFKAFASATKTKPGYDLEQFEVEGNSSFYEFKLEHPITRSRNYNWYGDAAIDFRNVKSRNNIEPTRKDFIRAFRLGTNLEFLDTILGAGINNINVKYSAGLEAFGSSEKGDANLSRQFGDPSFHKFEAEVQRLQRINNKWNILAAAKGQMANTALLSSEEFGVGGTSYGRGYDGSEIVGEEGFAAKLEIQWRTPKPIELFNDYQLYGFYDVGRVWNDDATTNALERQSLASAGFGFDGLIGEKTNLGMFVAFPLTRDVQTQGDDDPRFYFSLSREF